MNEILCPVLAQRMGESLADAVEQLEHDATDQEASDRDLGPNDKHASFVCSVGGCAVQGHGELRKFLNAQHTQFVIRQAAECKLQIEPEKPNMTIRIFG